VAYSVAKFCTCGRAAGYVTHMASAWLVITTYKCSVLWLCTGERMPYVVTAVVACKGGRLPVVCIERMPYLVTARTPRPGWLLKKKWWWYPCD
jgi:hypothetical protein